LEHKHQKDDADGHPQQDAAGMRPCVPQFFFMCIAYHYEVNCSA
jgi:hypothetical protein